MKGAAERQFEKFRLSGSPRALGQVYDLLAPELFQLAQRLAGDPVQAEDLVQLTFVTAIERASSFHEGARVAPWLLGILAQHAKAEQRRGARRPDPLRLELKKELDPLGRAEQAELDRRIDAALATLPDAQRSVLVLRLRHGLNAAEIADALGRPAGTVRSQLARGLECLRATLPAGLVTGGVLALCLPRGIEAMRASVVGHANAVAPPLLVAAKGVALWSLVSLTEVLVMKKLVLAAVVLIGSLLGLRAVLGDDASSPGASEPASMRAAERLAVPQPAPEEPGKRAVLRAPAEADESARAAVAAEPEVPVLELLGTGTLEVHVRDSLGHTVSDEVCVVRPAGDWSMSAETWSARTDARGVALLEGVPVGDFLVRLLRGPEATVKILDGSKTVQILELLEGVDVRGVVVDGFGEPVSGAEIWMSERWHVRRGFVVSKADALGRFLLRSVPRDNYIGALAPGFGISYVQAPRAKAGGEDELRIVLDSKGQRVEIEVTDRAGQPLENAWVLVGDEENVQYRPFADGSSAPPSPPRRGRTDENGRVTLSSIPLGSAEVQARASGYGPSRVTTDVCLDRPTSVRLALLPAARLAGTVTDHQGRPVKFANVRVGARSRFASSETSTDPAGRYELTGLRAGTVELQAEKKGVGAIAVTLELQAGEQRAADLELIGKPRIFGTLVDADGNALREHTLVARESETRTQVGTAVSRAAGAFELHVEDDREYTVFVRSPGDWRDFPLLVRPGLRASSEPVQLQLPRAGRETVSVRLIATAPDGSPVQAARLELWHHELEIFRTFEASTEEGEFALDGLAPGKLQLTLRHAEHPMLRIGDFETVAGELLDLGPVSFLPSGALVGTLSGSEDAERLAALEIHVGKVGGEFGVVERSGARFTSSALSPGDFLVSISGDYFVPVFRTVSIEAGVVAEVEFRLERAGLCRIVLTVQKDAEAPSWVGGQAFDADGGVAWSGIAKAQEDGTFVAHVSTRQGHFRFEANDSLGRVARTTFDVVSLDVEAPSQRLTLQEIP